MDSRLVKVPIHYYFHHKPSAVWDTLIRVVGFDLAGSYMHSNGIFKLSEDFGKKNTRFINDGVLYWGKDYHEKTMVLLWSKLANKDYSYLRNNAVLGFRCLNCNNKGLFKLYEEMLFGDNPVLEIFFIKILNIIQAEYDSKRFSVDI